MKNDESTMPHQFIVFIIFNLEMQIWPATANNLGHPVTTKAHKKCLNNAFVVFTLSIH